MIPNRHQHYFYDTKIPFILAPSDIILKCPSNLKQKSERKQFTIKAGSLTLRSLPLNNVEV